MYNIMVTILCVIFAMIPEMIMFGIYKLSTPTGFWQSFAIMGVLFYFGIGVCFIFFMLALFTWFAALK